MDMTEPTTGSPWGSWFSGLMYTGGTLFAGALVLLYTYQDKMLYFPSIPGASKLTKDNPAGYRHPGEFGIEYEDLTIRTSDGVALHAWFMKHPDSSSRPTLLFFHGNAGNIGYRLPNAVHVFHKAQCNLVLVDYRGYGHSEGEPTEQGLKLDAEASLAAILARSDVDQDQIFVFGRSLGGAVAVHLAQVAPDKIAGLVLENTFLSISAMVDALLPFLRVVKPVVLRMHWDSARVLPGITAPILFVAGLHDELVPHSHMQQLFASATASRRAVWFAVPQGTHNDTWLRGGERYFEALRRFLAVPNEAETATAPATPAAGTEEDKTNTETCAAPAREGAIPTMLQQPLFSSLQATKPKTE